MTHFFQMGGYAGYVWPAFGATFVGIGGIIWSTLGDYARARRKLAELERDDRG
jgi:heme exporter protein CcmD